MLENEMLTSLESYRARFRSGNLTFFDVKNYREKSSAFQ